MKHYLATVVLLQVFCAVSVSAQTLIWDTGSWDVNSWAAGADVTTDTDGDGIADIGDSFPNDPAASVDTDGDGYPDIWNLAASQEQITASPLALDALPNDPYESVDADHDGVGANEDVDDNDPDLGFVMLADAILGLVDLNLQACVQAQTAGILTVGEVTEIVCDGYLASEADRILSLEGLEAFTRATTIRINEGGWDTVLPLQNLVRLERLELNNASTSPSIAPLANLTNLRELSLESYQYDYDVLNGLANLERLVFNYSTMTALPNFSALTKLRELYLAAHSISDVSNITTMPQLTVLVIDRNELTSLGALSSATNLTTLKIQNNPIVDLSGISNLTNLQVLEFDLQSAVDLFELTFLSQLTNLHISAWPVDLDLSFIGALTKLDQLTINNQVAVTLPDFSNLPALRDVTFRGSAFADLSYLTQMTGIERFQLSFVDVPVQNFSNLNLLTSLNSLELGIGLQSFPDLSALSLLQYVTLTDSAISDISNLALWTPDNLQRLDLARNQIRVLGGALDNLTQGGIDLTGNPLDCADLALYQASKPAAVNLQFDSACINSPTPGGVGIARIELTHTGGSGFAVDDVVITIDGVDYTTSFDDEPYESLISTNYATSGVSFEVLSNNQTGVLVDLESGSPYGTEDFGSSLPQCLHVGGGAIALNIVDPATGTPSSASAITMRLGDGDDASESFRVDVYDVLGNIVNRESFTTGAGWRRGGIAYGYDYNNAEQPPVSFDTDGDGVRDSEDDLIDLRAASVDTDGDGYPDAWNANATGQQILDSTLHLDAFPNNSAASLDSDADGRPDAWNTDCDLVCQQGSGLVLDTDIDNDGIEDLADPFPDDPTPITPISLEGLNLARGLIGFVDAYEGTNPDFPISDTGVDNWFFNANGTYQRASLPGSPTGLSGRYVIEDRSGPVIFTEDLYGLSGFFGQVYEGPNVRPEYAEMGIYEVTVYTHMRWALVSFDGVRAVFARQVTSEVYALDANAVFDPALPLDVIEEPISFVTFLSLSSALPFTEFELSGATFAIDGINARLQPEGGFACPSSGDCTDLIQFNSNGTGQALKSGRSITWALSSEGDLVITPDAVGGISVSFTVSKLREYPNGFGAYVDAVNGDDRVGVFGFMARSENDIDISPFLGRGISSDLLREPSSRNELAEVTSAFGWRLDPDEQVQMGVATSGSGKYIFYRCLEGQACSATLTEMTWSYDGGSVVALDRYDPPEWQFDRRRTWDVLSATADELYVLETLIFTDYTVDPVSVDRYSRIKIYGAYESIFKINDVDGDGVMNEVDAFPLDEGASLDTDADGMPDDYNENCATSCQSAFSLVIDDDDDNDGILDVNDYYPIISIGDLLDEDRDGRPDVCEAACQNVGMEVDPCPSIAGACWSVSGNATSGYSGDIIELELSSDRAIEGLEGFDFVITYDPAVLRFDAFVASAPGLAEANDTVPGQVTVSSATSASTAIDIDGLLGLLRFEVLREGTGAYSAELIISGVTVNSMAIPVSAQPTFEYLPSIAIIAGDFRGSPLLGRAATMVVRLSESVDLLEGADLIVDYDPAVLAFKSVTTPYAPGDLFDAFEPQAGTVRISFADGAPVAYAANDEYLIINFDVLEAGEAWFESTLTLSGAKINGTPAWVAIQPIFHYDPVKTLYGSATLWSGAVNAGGALAGDVVWYDRVEQDDQVMSSIASDGSFALTGPSSRGELSLNLVQEPGRALSALDAVVILRVTSGRDSGFRNAFTELLADVDGENGVTSVDASRILQASVGNYSLPFIRKDGASGLWLVKAGLEAGESVTFDLASPDLDVENLGFVAGFYGDVTGNWTAPASAATVLARSSLATALPSNVQALALTPTLSMEVTERDPANDTYKVSLAIDTNGLSVFSVSLDFEATDAVVEAYTVDGGNLWQDTSGAEGYQLLTLDAFQGAAGLMTLTLKTSADVGRLGINYAVWGPESIETGVYIGGEEEFGSLPPTVLLGADDDQDGVIDRDDLCEATVQNSSVNADGCALAQLDSDGDGVNDAVDICVQTPAAEVTDPFGCSTSQLDTDDDGITNNADQCPSTTAGIEVDAQGCAITAMDTDGDGVQDDADQCPATPANDSANLTGCGLTQIDTDADGLSDAVEIEVGTDPTNADSDGDGLDDFTEFNAPTDALNPDSDGDSWSDGEEIDEGTNPVDSEDEPTPNGLNLSVIKAVLDAQAKAQRGASQF